MSTFIVGAIVLILMILAVRSIIKSKKNGECNCGGSCKSCRAHCHESSHK